MTRLRELIEERSITQQAVANDLGWPRRTLNNYVCGTREMDHAGICKVCDYFGCTADYLLGRTSARLPALTDEQDELVRTYEALPLAIRQAVDGLMAPYRAGSEQKKAL
ncbi:MAG: helix-turn-helix transcriptional regulator [Clostridia bacterium]|nr:helix-turn-helix transcriptional regulator [Clostridia bacterium]